MEKISLTKLQILRLCVNTKTWTEIIELTGLSKPTIKSHLSKLVDQGFLDKIAMGYKTTSKGIEQSAFKLNRREYATSDKIPSEVHNMINEAILPGLTLKDRVRAIFAMGILRNLKEIKPVRLFLNDLSKAIRDSVVVWLPKDLSSELDNNSYKVVNQLIAKQIKSVQKFEEKGKLQIIIDFDLPLALDNVINDQKDEAIKKKLIENKEKILQTLYNNWARITK